jgi:cytochrome P450
MTGFYPPFPSGQKKKLNLFQRILRARYNLLNAFYEKSYAMKLGEVRAPFRRLFFLNQHTFIDETLKDPLRYPKSDLMGALLDQLLGQSIFITNGEQWQNQRVMMAPALENARIQETFESMVDAAGDMVERMSAHSDGAPYFVDHEMAHVTADIIFRTIFSRPMTKENSKVIFEAFVAYQELAYTHGLFTMAGLPQKLSLPRLRALKHSKAVRALLDEYVDERLNAQDKEIKSDILQSLIEARHPITGEGFTRSGLVDQVGIMFLAGHETSASALTWALYLISNVPEVAARMQQEADLFWAEKPHFRNLKMLKYTRDVFRETMRLYPPVYILLRDASKDETIGSKKVPKGSILFISPWLVQRHTKMWVEPNMFDPDRFSDPAQDETIRNNYLPFSKGPRVCLGASFALQEAVIVLSAILRNFDIEKVEDHIPEPVARLTLRPINGVAIRLRKRFKPTPAPADSRKGAT